MIFIEKFLNNCNEIVNNIDKYEIEKIINILVEIRKNKGRLFVIGSGGGSGHASHAVCDFRKICAIEAYAPYDNISELTARTNDEGWNSTITKWLMISNFNENDALFIFSVGGGNIQKDISMNIVNAIKLANEINAKVIGIVGKDGGYTKLKGDGVIVIPNINESIVTPLTEGFQSIIWHLIVSHPKLKINRTTW